MKAWVRVWHVARCPILSLSVEHYRDDGTCKCREEVRDGPDDDPRDPG